jgi:hypothetical protein
VVELRAVFVDGKTSTGVLEMPLYAHRDLWHWLEAAPRNVHEKVAVLRQALCGLEHVHRAGVVHADVKPENVFVGADGSARLGDFDVSHDDATRVTMATTLIGFTSHYAAPELLTGAPASKASDVFAFGLTLHDVVLGRRALTRPHSIDALAAHDRSTASERCATLRWRAAGEASAARPTTSAALALALFALPAPNRDPQRDRLECTICFGTFWRDEGLACNGAEAHFVCSGDAQQYAASFCGMPLAEVARRGALCCDARVRRGVERESSGEPRGRRDVCAVHGRAEQGERVAAAARGAGAAPSRAGRAGAAAARPAGARRGGRDAQAHDRGADSQPAVPALRRRVCRLCGLFRADVRQVSCRLLRVVPARLRRRRASARGQLRAEQGTTGCVRFGGAIQCMSPGATRAIGGRICARESERRIERNSEK